MKKSTRITAAIVLLGMAIVVVIDSFIRNSREEFFAAIALAYASTVIFPKDGN